MSSCAGAAVTPQDFKNDGNEFTETFSVEENGTYTVYVKDQAGNEYVEEVYISGIDKMTVELVSATLTSNNLTQGFAKKGDIIFKLVTTNR